MKITTNYNTITIHKGATSCEIASRSLRKYFIEKLGVKPKAHITFNYLGWDTERDGPGMRVQIEGIEGMLDRSYRKVYIVCW